MFSVLALLFALAGSPAPVPTPQSLHVVVLQAPAAKLHVQVATTGDERERGLMGVTHLPPHTGMLFVFDNDAPVEFWMKDTLIPLDMVFISRDGAVRSVAAKVPVVPVSTPDQDIPRREGTGKYVLELPSGEAVTDGLRPGVRIRNLPE
jgi:uncharacterized membrane protein (UPF0127 family)